MPIEIESLIPHRAPMRWIDALTSDAGGRSTATVTFTTDHFAIADGTVLETALIECVAQTVAAAVGLRARNGSNPNPAKGGMLAAVNGFRFHTRPPIGKALIIETEERKRFGPMLLVAGTVYCDGELIASGELTLYA